MFGYRSNVPKVRLTTDRLVVRLVHERDAWRLADYYAENRHFLKPWEPVRDESHCYPSGWQARFRITFFFKTQSRQQITATFIVRHIVGHNAMNVLSTLHITNSGGQGFKH